MNRNWVKNIILYVTGQTITTFGSSLVQYAIIWYVALETKSGVMLMFSTIFGLFPQLIISIFAGVWADRYNRKAMMIIADVFTAVATLILAIFFLNGYDHLWLVFLVLAIRSIGTGVQYPASSSITPQIVPKEKLMRVNGIRTTIRTMAEVVAPSLGGALLTFASLETIFFIDVVTAIIGITFLMFTYVPKHKRQEMPRKTSTWSDLQEGFHYVKKHEYLKNLFLLYIYFTLLIVPSTILGPIQVVRVFGNEVWRLTVLEVLDSIGSIVGGLVVSIWGGFKKPGYTILLACAIYGVTGLFLGLADNFVLYAIISGIMGLGLPLMNTPIVSIVQEYVEVEITGRIFGIFLIIFSLGRPLGMLVAGPLADFTNIGYLFIFCGLLLIIISVHFFLLKKLDNLPKKLQHEVIEKEEA